MEEEQISFWNEEGECVIAYNYTTESAARKAIHKMELQDLGLDREDLFKGKLKAVDMVKIRKDGEDFYTWNKKEVDANADKVKQGFIGFI